MELIKEEYDKACQEQVDEVCLQNSIKQFRKWCAGAGQEVTYHNFQNWIHEPYYEDLQRRLTREYEEQERKHEQYEWEAKLMADGYRKVTLSVYGKEPITKWILRTQNTDDLPLDAGIPLKDNYILFNCDV